MWGCVACYQTLDLKRTKLGARATESVFTEYAHNSKAYRFLDFELGIVLESRYVKFFEERYCSDDENSNSTTSTSTSPKIHPLPLIIEEPRRSTRYIIEKNVGDYLYSYLAGGIQKKIMREVIFSINLNDDPKTFSESMTSGDALLWKEAIIDKMDSIMGNRNWELADVPKGRRTI